MSLSRWKELAQRKTKAGKAVNELYDDITKEKIRSKTTDQSSAELEYLHLRLHGSAVTYQAVSK